MGQHVTRFAKIILIILVVIAGSAINGVAASVQATVDTTRISSGESLNLKVTVDDGDAKVDTSPIADFTVSPRGQSTSIQIINSRYSKEINYNFLLFPKKTGNLTIPALPVTQDGKTVYTRPIAITVSDDPSHISGSSDIFVRALISKHDPYVGEQVVYVFQLFQAVDITNARLQEPSFDGFFSKKIGDQTTRQKVINGRNYTVTEVRYVLIADNPGQVVIEPSVLAGSVARPGSSSRGFPFDSFFNTRAMESRQYRTDSIQMNIRPLPPVPDPGMSFSGLVGNFTINSYISDTQVKAGDSTTLTVTVQGQGNLIDLNHLDVTVPEQWKVYDDKPAEDIKTGPQGFSGEKTFHYALVPVKAGNYVISPVDLVYFDPQTDHYKTVSTDKISVSVTPSAAVTAPQLTGETLPETGSRPAAAKKRTVKLTGHDILPVKDDLSALKDQSHMSLGIYFTAVAGPGILAFGILGFILGIQRRHRPEKLLRKNALQIINGVTPDQLKKDDTLAALAQALGYAVRYRSRSRGVSITSPEVRQQLQEEGCDLSLIQSAEQLLAAFESIRYSGVQPDSAMRSDLFSQSVRTIKALCK